GVLAKQDCAMAFTTCQALREITNPDARLAPASGQRLRLSSLPSQRAQGDFQRRRRFPFNGIAPAGRFPAIAIHQSHIPNTIQRAGECLAPTSSRVEAPSLVRITREPTAPPRLSIAKSGSPSSWPSGVNNCTTSSRQPVRLGCFAVETACPTTTPICISQHPHGIDGGGAPLPRERQRRRHALPRRRGNAEAQIALAAR